MDTLNPQLLAAGFEPVEVRDASDDRMIRHAITQYERMILCVLLTILDRYERDASYGWLDTKVDLITGEDARADDPLRGKGAVYMWIQGRGMEALAGHARWVSGLSWLTATQQDAIIGRIRRVLATLAQRMEGAWIANGGGLSFMMTPTGRALGVDNDGRVIDRPLPPRGPANLSDLFYCKGLAAAAALLHDDVAMAAACHRFIGICGDIRSGRFTTDQEALDPRNPVRPVAGRYSLGPRMIGIGAAMVFVEVTGNGEYAQVGIEFIEHILARHVAPPDDEADMWEFVDSQGRAYHEGSAVRSDPGHATEFVGLALKCLRVCEDRGLLQLSDCDRVAALRRRLHRVLLRNFENGWSPRGIGICKGFDLVSRTPMNTDMPWWSLPETMRAGTEAWATAAPPDRNAVAQIVRLCSNAFMRYYVRPDRWLMANQTVNAQGQPVAVIPATPDADPGYHTGLSLIDALTLLQRQSPCRHEKK